MPIVPSTMQRLNKFLSHSLPDLFLAWIQRKYLMNSMLAQKRFVCDFWVLTVKILFYSLSLPIICYANWNGSWFMNLFSCQSIKHQAEEFHHVVQKHIILNDTTGKNDACVETFNVWYFDEEYSWKAKFLILVDCIWIR